MENDSKRAVVYANVTDIPGHPQRRFHTLAAAFCNEVLGRELQLKLDPSWFDHVHIPPDYDSGRPLKRWFIIDFGVRGELSTQSVQQLPHLVYLASYQDEEWAFIPREMWTQKAIAKTNTYTWGGRREQRTVAEMRRENNENKQYLS
ncbi:hypothetical protein BJY01DRAFT_238745 [Aspergillus pseudoustus]|uniref:Uncharacterized protein n=1 Tax=Aspergillus pseudoustus TaxID=1810923 RepID=A0ABR4J695_9EURO